MLTLPLFACVKVLVDLPALHLKAGAIGMVVGQGHAPCCGYTIEFVGDRGQSMGTVSVPPSAVASL